MSVPVTVTLSTDDIVRMLDGDQAAGVSRGRRVSADDTAQAARALGLAVPDEYVAVAEKVGHLAGPGWGVFGMRRDAAFPRSAAGATVVARLADPDFPCDLLVIAELGGDRLACLDCGAGPTRGAVLEIALSGRAQPRLVADGLVGYIAHCVGLSRESIGLDEVATEFGLVLPPELAGAWDIPVPVGLARRIFRPLRGSQAPSLRYALDVLAQAAQPAPDELLPLHLVDSRSLACVVCARAEERPASFGCVVRWHLDDVPGRAQGRLLDHDARRYVATVVRAEEALAEGKRQLAEAVETYAKDYGDTVKPRPHVYRPVRLACQNVLLGEAVWAHDARFDGLNVRVWMSSQEAHVNAHEAARSLTAMMLAEAFRSGGTMEVRFDEHAEGRVPAALAQWARIAGVDVDDERSALTPAVSRELMLAATDMPSGLRDRIDVLAAHGGLSIERACYTLLAGIWRPIELDFMLASSPRVLDILRGGTDSLNSPRHQAELDVCRSASMLGTLLARLQQPRQMRAKARDDNAVAIALEDQRMPVSWHVLEEYGAVRFTGVTGPLPWLTEASSADGAFTVLPRPLPTMQDCAAATRLALGGCAVAVLTPQDVATLPDDAIAHMHHPDRRSALDRATEANLLASRVGRR